MLTFLIGLLFLCLLVVFHELGHFVAAKAFGIRVERFSVGFGKALAEWRHGDTVYSIAALPLGGFVKMAGESPDDDEATGAPDEFMAKPWWQRFVVVTGGPAANLIFALVANTLIGIVGIDYQMQPTIIDRVGEVAEAHGFRPGDQIVALNGEPVDQWHKLIVEKDEGAVLVGVQRGGGRLALEVPGAEFAGVVADLAPWSDTVVGEVNVGLPAYQAGLLAGDRIQAIDGVPVSSWLDMRDAISTRPGEELTLTVDRQGEVFDVALTTSAQEVEPGRTEGFVGISADGEYARERLPLGVSLRSGWDRTWDMTKQVYAGFGMMVTRFGNFRENVAGPITIAQLAGSSKRPSQILYILSYISIALMALNLLPIPILDGGHAVFCLIEGIRGQALSLRTQLTLQKVGLVILGSLVILAVFNDVRRVVQRAQAVHRLESQETTATPR